MVEKKNDDQSKESTKPSEGFSKFLKAMQGQSSDVTKLLNCHLLAEYYLEQIIHVSIKRGDILLTDGQLRFATKLHLVRALDEVSDSTLTSLKHLNTVRNLCSHSMDYEITEANIDLIGRPLGKDYTLDVKEKHKDDILGFTLAILIGRLEGSYDALVARLKKSKPDNI